MTLEAPENQEMNEKVEVTWIKLRTIEHSVMVHARVSEAYINFASMYTKDHIFTILPIKDLINKDSDLTTPYKLATGMKPSVSHLRALCCTCVAQKSTAHVGKKTLNMRHQAQKVFTVSSLKFHITKKDILCTYQFQGREYLHMMLSLTKVLLVR